MKAKMRTNTDPIEEMTEMSPSTTEETEGDSILLDRNTYKSIKKMDRASLEALVQDIYDSGRKKGLEETAAKQEDAHTVDYEKLREEIRGISGIGEKRADSIMEIVRKYIQK